MQGFATKLALTGASASIAETITYPIDAIKTRLQLQVGGHFVIYTGSKLIRLNHEVAATCCDSVDMR